jgi:hypothetical protein
MNYNALVLFSHELLIVLLFPHELLFCTKKPLLLVKAVNSNGQFVTLHHFVPMNYNTLLFYPINYNELSLYPYKLQRIITLIV